MPLHRRAPFNWSPQQKIDPTGHLAGLVGGKVRGELPNRWFMFRRTMQLDSPPTSAPMSITVVLCATRAA
jgi:hypothetical protein